MIYRLVLARLRRKMTGRGSGTHTVSSSYPAGSEIHGQKLLTTPSKLPSIRLAEYLVRSGTDT